MFRSLRRANSASQPRLGTQPDQVNDATEHDFAWRDWWCLIWHHSLEQVDASDGVVRAKCLSCRREYMLHPEMRAALPWRDLPGGSGRGQSAGGGQS